MGLQHEKEKFLLVMGEILFLEDGRGVGGGGGGVEVRGAIGGEKRSLVGGIGEVSSPAR